MQPALIVRARRTVQSRHHRLPASGSPLGNSNSPCAPPPSTVHCSPDVADERAVSLQAHAAVLSVSFIVTREPRESYGIFAPLAMKMRCLGETRRLWPRACLDYRQPNTPRGARAGCYASPRGAWRARRAAPSTPHRAALGGEAAGERSAGRCDAAKHTAAKATAGHALHGPPPRRGSWPPPTQRHPHPASPIS